MTLLQALTTGSAPTHGTPTGVNQVSSELSRVTAALMRPPTVASPMYNQLSSSNDLQRAQSLFYINILFAFNYV
jgi:hypothetical protein